MYAELVAGTDEKAAAKQRAHFKASALLKGNYEPHSADNWLVDIAFTRICLQSHTAQISKQLQTAPPVSGTRLTWLYSCRIRPGLCLGSKEHKQIRAGWKCLWKSVTMLAEVRLEEQVNSSPLLFPLEHTKFYM